MTKEQSSQTIISSLVNCHLQGRSNGTTLTTLIARWQMTQKFPPVLLLVGQQGIGKTEVVRHLTQWLLCPKSGYTSKAAVTSETCAAACGQCAVCARFISGNEVNITEISSATEPLKIDSFRRLKATVGFGAHEGLFRIVWIFGADRMTPQAANSILKLLEEPPPGWIFFLTANDASLLLPTIRSRCHVVRLAPLSQKQIKELLTLAEVDPEKREICARLAQGSWHRGYLFASDDVWKLRKALTAFLENPLSEIQELIDLISQETSHFENMINLLELWVADLIRWSLTPSHTFPHTCPPSAEDYPWPDEMDQDCRKSLIRHATQIMKCFHQNVALARGFWMKRAEHLCKVRSELPIPLNRKLLLQGLLLPWVDPAIRQPLCVGGSPGSTSP